MGKLPVYLAFFAPLAFSGGIGCDKPSGTNPTSSSVPTGTVAASAKASSTAAQPSGTAAAQASGSASNAAATATAGATYTGDYKAAASKLTVPDTDTYKGFKFRGAESDEGVGPGTLELKVGDGGRVAGEGTGALGAFLLSGFFKDGELTAQVLRKGKDGGFTGFLQATETAAGFAGTMRVSLGGGNVLREATLNLKKK